jgi:hypothetical protein
MVLVALVARPLEFAEKHTDKLNLLAINTTGSMTASIGPTCSVRHAYGILPYQIEGEDLIDQKTLSTLKQDASGYDRFDRIYQNHHRQRKL